MLIATKVLLGLALGVSTILAEDPSRIGRRTLFADDKNNNSKSLVSFNNSSNDEFATSNASSPYTVDSDPSSYTSVPFPYPLNTSFGHSEHPVSRWNDAHAKARAFLTNWTLEEKVTLTTGTGWQIGRCVGNIPAIPLRNFSGLCLEDSELGVRDTDFVSAFPAGINAAAT